MVNQANLQAAIDAETERRYHLTPEEREFAALFTNVWIDELKARAKAKRAEMKKNAAGGEANGKGECLGVALEAQQEKPDVALV